jgi:hypothetical protein
VNDRAMGNDMAMAPICFNRFGVPETDTEPERERQLAYENRC